jgi:hypothetical protein
MTAAEKTCDSIGREDGRKWKRGTFLKIAAFWRRILTENFKKNAALLRFDSAGLARKMTSMVPFRRAKSGQKNRDFA